MASLESYDGRSMSKSYWSCRAKGKVPRILAMLAPKSGVRELTLTFMSQKVAVPDPRQGLILIRSTCACKLTV